MTAAAMRGSPRSLGQQIKENQVGRRGKWQRSCLGTLTMVCSVNAFAARRKQQFAEDNDYIIHGTNRETSVFPASSEQGAPWGFFKKWRGTFSICCDCLGDPEIKKERAASLDLSFFIHWRGTRQEGDPLLTSLSLDVNRRQGGGENAAIARDGKETDRRFLRKFVHFSSFGEFGEWFHVPEPLASRNFTIKLASES